MAKSEGGSKGLLIVGIVVLVVVVGFVGYMMGGKDTVSSVSTGEGGGYTAAGSGGGGTSYSNESIDYSEILIDLKDKLKNNPNDSVVLGQVGDVYFDLRQFSDAVDYYKRALEADPVDVDSYNDLGLAYHYMGDSAKAVDVINTGIEKNPYYQRIWLTKGFILAYGTGDVEGAVEAWGKANSLDPQSQVGIAAADFLAQFQDK